MSTDVTPPREHRLFSGRVVLPGAASGLAVVSRAPFDAVASCLHSLVGGRDVVVSGDVDNPEILDRTLTGSVLCVPSAVGSTSAGPTWDLLTSRGLAPAAILFAGSIDPLTAGGLVVASVWSGSTAPVVDRLGAGFLDAVHTGLWLEVGQNGSVRLGHTSSASPERGNHPNG